MSSIYRSEAGRQLLQRRYHDYLQSWPLPAEHRRIPTRHGETFVAAAGTLPPFGAGAKYTTLQKKSAMSNDGTDLAVMVKVKDTVDPKKKAGIIRCVD